MYATGINDKEYQGLVNEMKEKWEVIKSEVQFVRAGGDKHKLFDLSKHTVKFQWYDVVKLHSFTQTLKPCFAYCLASLLWRTFK